VHALPRNGPRVLKIAGNDLPNGRLKDFASIPFPALQGFVSPSNYRQLQRLTFVENILYCNHRTFTQMVNMTNYATPITTWTRFHVLLENSLHDMNESNDLGRKWISTFRPLLQAVGHEHSTWGRVQSNPGVVLLSTCTSTRKTKALPFASPQAMKIPNSKSHTCTSD
jgi:hypothetical protein